MAINGVDYRGLLILEMLCKTPGAELDETVLRKRVPGPDAHVVRSLESVLSKGLVERVQTIHGTSVELTAFGEAALREGRRQAANQT